MADKKHVNKYGYKMEYRIECAGRHVGPRHMFDKWNLEAALSAADRWNKAKSEDTRRNCLPMTVQVRAVATWTELWSDLDEDMVDGHE